MSQEIQAKATEVETQVKEITDRATARTGPGGRYRAAGTRPTRPLGGEPSASGMDEIDMGDTNSIVSFGSTAQAELQEISQAMLADVKNKDVGPAGSSLRDIVGTIRGFSVDELDPNRKRSWWERLLGKAEPIAGFMAKYEDVQGQIDKITDDLLGHEHTLLKDIKSLDLLYDKTLAFYDELALYISAGEAKLGRAGRPDHPGQGDRGAGRARGRAGDEGAGAARPARRARRSRAPGA